MSVLEAFQLSRDARRDSDECLGDICVLEIVWEPELKPASWSKTDTATIRVEMELSPKNSAFESWFERCSELYSLLTSQGCKFTFSFKLEGSILCSLSSEKAVPPRAKKWFSPCYMRQQQRRKADLLKNSLVPSRNGCGTPPRRGSGSGHQHPA